MDYLWKLDATVEDKYVDIFAIARGLCGTDLDEWDAYISTYLHLPLKQKDNSISKQLLSEGHDRFRVGQYRDALEKYNQSLCFAEKGSEYECLSYANRAKCFMQMEQYTNALIDIEQAIKFNKLTGQIRLRLQSQQLECNDQLRLSPPSVTCVPKLSFSADKNIICMANVLEIAENEVFGRHIVAKCDIDVDKVVMVSDIFASVTVSDTLTSCSHCNKIERNLIACAECPNVMFCIGTCSNRNGVHLLECGSIFQLIGDPQMKLPVQTILMAIKMFPTVNNLMDFVRKCIGNKKLPDKIKDLKSRYALFLKLAQRMSNACLYPAYQVYTTLMCIRQVKQLFDTEEKRTFLMHLTIHHTTILRTNGFRHERKNIGHHKMTTDYVYDVLSLINHSCSPNLFNYSTSDDISYCVTVRPIPKGSQLFINYLGNTTKMAKIERQEQLKLTWDFVCKCEKCEPDQMLECSNSLKANMKNDKSYQYVRNTCQRAQCKVNNSECGKRQHLKSECIKFLNKFGHLTWSHEIQVVTNCLTLH